MATLGTFLREAREARGIDLRDAAQQTRISINYLRALEEENFAKLPGEVFIRGFLKNYSRFLALDEAEVLQKYAELRAPKPSAPAPEAEALQPAAVVEEPKESKRMLEPFLWVGGIIVILVLFFFFALPSRPVDKGTSSKVKSGATGTATANKGEKLSLDITALDNTWLLVRIDASPQKKAVLKKGETMTWTADERFQLSYGSAGSLKLALNGKELTVNLPTNAMVRDLTINASGIVGKKLQQDAVKPKSRREQPAVAPRSNQTGTQPAAKPRQNGPADKPVPAPEKPRSSGSGTIETR